MSLPDIDSLLALDVEPRLELVQKLWDSVFQDAQHEAAMSVSAQDCELLDARLKEDDDDPDAAIPWTEARAEMAATVTAMPISGGRPARGSAPR